MLFNENLIQCVQYCGFFYLPHKVCLTINQHKKTDALILPLLFTQTITYSGTQCLACLHQTHSIQGHTTTDEQQDQLINRLISKFG